MTAFLPSSFIVSSAAIEYEKQGLSHCGAYSVKSILNSVDKYRNRHPKCLHNNVFCKITGTALGKDYYVNILKSQSITASFHSVPKAIDNKLSILKQLLVNDNPVMLQIGNGYLPNGAHSKLLSNILTHWITLWGYADSEECFYLYDSAVPKNSYDNKLPIGNVKRSYEQVLRDWGKRPILSFFTRTAAPFSYLEVYR